MPQITVTNRTVKPDFRNGLITGLGAGLVAVGWLLIFGVITDQPAATGVAFGLWVVASLIWALLWPRIRKVGLVWPVIGAVALLSFGGNAVLQATVDQASIGAAIFTFIANVGWFLKRYRGK